MKRRAHTLSANKGHERPRRIIYLDSESAVVQDRHYPYLCVVRYVTDRTDRPKTSKEIIYQTHTALRDMLPDDITAFATAKRERTVLIAHNVEYDLLVLGLLPKLVARGWRCKDFFCKGLTSIIRFQWGSGKDTRTLVCQSSTNIYQTSLVELGKLFGVAKHDVDVLSDGFDTIRAYCIQDVNILQTAMESFTAFVEREDLGVQALTVAGQSFNAFRHRFMEHTIQIHDNQTVLDLERDSYIGGRVECFRLGEMPEQTWRVVDVNSMYPAVMRDERYPIALRDTIYRPSLSTIINHIMNGQCVIADVTVRTETARYATVHDEKLLFPVGTFDTTLTTPDLIGGIERGEIIDVRYTAIYDAAPIFTAFVDYFYEKKRTANDPIMRYFYKLILNSCYGKFGQRQDEMRAVDECAPDIAYTKEHCWNAAEHKAYIERAFGGTVFECYETRNEAFNSFPGIAAHVTAYARRLLWDGIETANIENVVYCDTDSLFTNDAGFARMESAGIIDDAAIGKWADEKQTDHLIIHGPKDYVFGGVTKLKGVRKGSKQIAPNQWEIIAWPRLVGSIAAGKLDSFANTRHVKTMTRHYTKGNVSDSGVVTAFSLDKAAILRE